MIGKQTRVPPSPFRMVPVMLVLLLSLTGFAHAQFRNEGTINATTREALEGTLSVRRMAQPADAAPDPLYEFYARRDFRPAWSGNRRAEEAGALALAVLAESDSQGLRPADYDATSTRWNSVPEAGVAAAAYDLSLTEDLLRYARDVRLGRVDPSRVYADVALPLRQFDAGTALNQALADGTLDIFLAGLPPPHREYRDLVAALARYRKLDAEGGWPLLPAKGGARQDLLMLRLALEDESLAAAPNEEELFRAVMRFQTRNGLGADGRIGAATLAALNVPVRGRIDQIIANLERWRWLPRQFESRTVRVNVPDQMVEYYRNNTSLLSSRVAVGKLTSKTPIVRMMGLSLVANPSWEVPGDIAQASILPRLRQNPRYLAENNMVLVNGPPGDPQGLSIDWRKLKTLPYDIDQNPGEKSAMGNLMLDSPNDFGVYLHDTPGKEVFEPAARQKSNGCIRVQDMSALAALIMADGEFAETGALDQAVARGVTERLRLGKPVPVYLLYWTAVADSEGNVGFRSDFYGRDKPLLAALSAGRRNAKPAADF